MKDNLTREEIEKYGKFLDSEEVREFLGIKKCGGGTYSMFDDGDKSSLILTGRLGAIRFIKQLCELTPEKVEKLLKSHI